MTREEIESQDNWVATFVIKGSGYDCLMLNPNGGYYWCAPSKPANIAVLSQAISGGIVELVAGDLPTIAK